MSDDGYGGCETNACETDKTEPNCVMEDTKQSDLASLEAKTGNTIIASRNVKGRLRNILAKLKNVETCEESSKEAPEPCPSNRLGGIENGVRKIDNEIADMNAIAETLEGILG